VDQKERGMSEKNRFCHLYMMVIQARGMRLSGKSKGQKRIGPRGNPEKEVEKMDKGEKPNMDTEKKYKLIEVKK